MSESRPDTDTDMLAALVKKKADVMRIGEKTGKSMTAALDEVDRQLEQVVKGEEVTKSGAED